MKVKITESGTYSPGFTPNAGVNIGYGKGVIVVTEDNLEKVEAWIRCGRGILLDPPKLKGFYEASHVLPVAGPEPPDSVVDTKPSPPKAKRRNAKL
jgi:hypothetical protein